MDTLTEAGTVFHDINLRDFGDIPEEAEDQAEQAECRAETPEPETPERTSDAEWDTDLEDEGYRRPRRVLEDDEACRQLYLAACRRLHIIPASCFTRAVQTSTFNLSFQGLGPLGVKAVATALVIDKTSTSLLLAGNFIGRDGVRYVCEMLKENIYLTHLDVSENDLDAYGLEMISEIFRENDTITSLNLSGNKFKSPDAEHIANILSMSQVNRDGRSSGVRSLDLSHNEFGDVGANTIGHALGDNETLTYLSLAWNQIRKAGIECLAKGVAENTCLRVLDLSYNGVDDGGAEVVAGALTSNTCLHELNLNSNRAGLPGLTALFKALAKNDTLKILRLSNNPITRHGPVTSLALLKESGNVTLQEFEIADACVPREFNALLEEVQTTRPDFRVTCGGFMNSADMVRADARFSADSWTRDPVLVFIQFVEERKYKLLDMFKTFDKDKSCTLSPEEFRTGLTRVGCGLDEGQLNELIRALDIDRSGEIDIEEFLDGFDKHKRRLQKYQSGSRSGSRAPSATPSGTPRPSRPSSRAAGSRPGSSVASTEDKENADNIKQLSDSSSLLQPPNAGPPLRPANNSTAEEKDYVLTVPHSNTIN